MLPNWSPEIPEWSEESSKLLKDSSSPQPADDVTLHHIITNSENFPIKFPIETIKSRNLPVSVEVLKRNANSTYPLVHENVLHLYGDFLMTKQKYGNSIEKRVYENMDLIQFVDRLLKKRALCFVGVRDSWRLITGEEGFSKWETIGTPQEKPPLVLENCLSYEEIKLSAFLSVSSFTYFINKGDRRNLGKVESNRNLIETEGVIIGIIGPRLKKNYVMDFQEIIISSKQNTRKNGYGINNNPRTIHDIFADLYGQPSLDYDDFTHYTDVSNRFITIKDDEIFDNHAYYKRLLFSLDTLFVEANQRALEKSQKAYVHVVGIGLGVWKRTDHQIKNFMDTCAQRLEMLGPKLAHISDVCFAWISHSSCGKYKSGEIIPIENHPDGGIRIHISKRDPHEKLQGVDAGKLLVVSYAWDGNALPGNEFWYENLCGSGDSSTASSTQVSELHNPHINPKATAANLRVVSDHKIMTFREYCQTAKID